MANYGTVRRASAASPCASMADQEDDSKEKDVVCSLKFVWPFSIPPTPEAAAARLVRNLANLALYYAQLMSIVLLITLIPKRKVSLVYLVIMKEITVLYLLLLNALPNSMLLHKIIDKRLVLFMLSVITANMLILTHAAIHLFASTVGSIPVILVHAVLWTSENNNAAAADDDDDDDAEELGRLVDNKDGDANPTDVV